MNIDIHEVQISFAQLSQ